MKFSWTFDTPKQRSYRCNNIPYAVASSNRRDAKRGGTAAIVVVILKRGLPGSGPYKTWEQAQAFAEKYIARHGTEI